MRPVDSAGEVLALAAGSVAAKASGEEVQSSIDAAQPRLVNRSICRIYTECRALGKPLKWSKESVGNAED